MTKSTQEGTEISASALFFYVAGVEISKFLSKFAYLKILKLHYEQKKCPICNSPIVKKDGTRKSVQRYKCMACGHRFSGGQEITTDYIWEMYLHGKQTVAQ